MSSPIADIAIVGGGAAGMAAAIFAAESAQEKDPPARIVVLEGARKPGAKILISGGGRCNVTNQRVTPQDYSGGPPPIIRNVLRAFDEKRTFEWMQSIGVQLKLESTSKYFPTTDKARTVLDALLLRMQQLGVDLRPGARVGGVTAPAQSADAAETSQEVFRIAIHDRDPLFARRVIMATGGLALPKSGSDGAGLNWMRQLGHTVTPTTPSLVPLLLGTSPSISDPGNRFADFAGVTMTVRLTLASSTGKHLVDRTGSLVFTHFGISGPAALDISRHVAAYSQDHPGTVTVLLGHPDLATVETADLWLQEQIKNSPRRLTATAVGELYPARLADAISAGLGEKLMDLNRQQRLELARRLAALPLTVIGNRGYTFAETTAGGVDLREVDGRTMQSRLVPGLFLCGEMLDVDGRIGGFNFQWAWASGFLAGRGAVDSL